MARKQRPRPERAPAAKECARGRRERQRPKSAPAGKEREREPTAGERLRTPVAARRKVGSRNGNPSSNYYAASRDAYYKDTESRAHAQHDARAHVKVNALRTHHKGPGVAADPTL